MTLAAGQKKAMNFDVVWHSYTLMSIMAFFHSNTHAVIKVMLFFGASISAEQWNTVEPTLP